MTFSCKLDTIYLVALNLEMELVDLNKIGQYKPNINFIVELSVMNSWKI